MNGIEALKSLLEGKIIKGNSMAGTLRLVQCGEKWWGYMEDKESGKDSFFSFLQFPLQGEYEVVCVDKRKKSTRSKNMSKKRKKIDISDEKAV